MTALGNQRSQIAVMPVAVEVDDHRYLWNSSVPTSRSVQRILEAVQAVRLAGLKPILYTNKKHWSQITGGSALLASYPLWWAFDGIRNDDLSDPNLQENKSFGGWSNLAGKQYRIEDTSTGTNVDLDVFFATALAPAPTTPGVAQDVTALVNVTRSGFRKRGDRYVQTVAITPLASVSAIEGPLTLVLDHLGTQSPHTSLFNKNGDTASTLPQNSPYIHVFAGFDNLLKLGQSTSVTLEFVGLPDERPTYDVRVLAGWGRR